MPKAETLTRRYAYYVEGKFYAVTVAVDPRELARDAIRKGLLDSKTRKAVRACGAVKLSAETVSQAEALRLRDGEAL